MTPGNGTTPPDGAEKSLGDIVTEVSEKASLLVREEIELAKAEVTQKVTRLGKGAAIGAAAGVFAFFAFVVFLHAVAWFFVDLFDWQDTIWAGFLATSAVLLVLGALAGFLAYRLFKRGAPLTPEMAIEEARITRETFEQQNIERDQLERGKV